jgi:hypothetical protein
LRFLDLLFPERISTKASLAEAPADSQVSIVQPKLKRSIADLQAMIFHWRNRIAHFGVRIVAQVVVELGEERFLPQLIGESGVAVNVSVLLV